MLVTSRLEEIPFDKNSVVTVGSFDGVHRAHQAVIQEVVGRAGQRGGRSVVVTFDPHPKEVLGPRPEEFTLLSTLEERRDICRELGVNVFYVIPFTYEFSRQDFREFFVRYIIQGIGVSEVVEGYDHHFGRDREGSIEELLKLGKEFQFSVVAMKPIYVGGEVVSSSRIRELLAQGDVEKAAEMLGRPYGLRGVVVRGDGRGKDLGFPTANIQPVGRRKILPKDGIYFVRVQINHHSYFGLSNVGVRPTFLENGQRLVEVYLLEFDGNLYGESLDIFFLKRLRDELKFSSADELVRQMELDREIGMRLATEFTKVHRLLNDQRLQKKQ